jgi:tRNA modification GTPase
MFDDTIAAISTPLGEGGLAIIRLSGSAALGVADRSFRPKGKNSLKPSTAPTHTIQYGQIVRRDQVVDEVLLSVLRAPRTFTRENMVEISCHGGLLPAKLVLDTVLENGARLAQPGEFTKRAFLNGRIDLTQAEAVADLIHSRTELALTAANEQLAGKLARFFCHILTIAIISLMPFTAFSNIFFSSAESFSSTILSKPSLPNTTGTPMAQPFTPYSPFKMTELTTTFFVSLMIASTTSAIAVPGA